MKLNTIIHHVSGHCGKRFQDQRSKVNVMSRAIDLYWRRHTFRRRGVDAYLLIISVIASITSHPSTLIRPRDRNN